MNTWAKLTSATSGKMGSIYKDFPWDLLFIVLMIIAVIAISIVLIHRYVHKRNE